MICKYCGKTINVASGKCTNCGRPIEALQGGDGYFGVLREMDNAGSASESRFNTATVSSGRTAILPSSDNGAAIAGLKKCENDIKGLQAQISRNAGATEQNSQNVNKLLRLELIAVAVTILLVIGMVVMGVLVKKNTNVLNDNITALENRINELESSAQAQPEPQAFEEPAVEEAVVEETTEEVIEEEKNTPEELDKLNSMFAVDKSIDGEGYMVGDSVEAKVNNLDVWESNYGLTDGDVLTVSKLKSDVNSLREIIVSDDDVEKDSEINGNVSSLNKEINGFTPNDQEVEEGKTEVIGYVQRVEEFNSNPDNIGRLVDFCTNEGNGLSGNDIVKLDDFVKANELLRISFSTIEHKKISGEYVDPAIMDSCEQLAGLLDEFRTYQSEYDEANDAYEALKAEKQAEKAEKDRKKKEEEKKKAEEKEKADQTNNQTETEEETSDSQNNGQNENTTDSQSTETSGTEEQPSN